MKAISLIPSPFCCFDGFRPFLTAKSFHSSSAISLVLNGSSLSSFALGKFALFRLPFFALTLDSPEVLASILLVCFPEKGLNYQYHPLYPALHGRHFPPWKDNYIYQRPYLFSSEFSKAISAQV